MLVEAPAMLISKNEVTSATQPRSYRVFTPLSAQERNGNVLMLQVSYKHWQLL